MPIEINYLKRADHDPGTQWPNFYREEKIAEGAGLRHDSRVSATLDAALAFTALAEDEIHPCGLTGRRIAEILIMLDLGGVGGPRGYGGGASRRMPWAAPLGSGRWGATDGAAWASAAEGAISTCRPVTPEEAAALFESDLLDEGPACEWPAAFAARRVMQARTPEEAHAWDEIRARAQHNWDLAAKDIEAERFRLATLLSLLPSVAPAGGPPAPGTTPSTVKST